MATARRQGIIDALRQRIRGGVQTGALRPGHRLPSTREIAADLCADPRVVAAAYRALEAEGLVDMRARSGIYLVSDSTADIVAQPATVWAVETLVAAAAHGLPLQRAAAKLRSLASTDGLKVVVAASMADQVDGLIRELREDFGIEAKGVLVDAVSRIDHWPRALERADLVITTPSHAERLRRFDRGARRPVLVAGVRQNVISDEWRLVLKGVCFVVVADPRFPAMVREFLRSAAGAERVTIRVAGRDSLHDIAPDAPTYITEAARRIIGRTRLPGRLIPPARILDDDSARRIVEFIVRWNEARA